MKYPIFIFLTLLCFGFASINLTAAEHEHEHEHEHEKGDHDDEELATKIDADLALEIGIETVLASPRVLQQTIVSYGSLTTDPQHLSHVRARYTGMIKSVVPSIGDKINQGDLMAEVESNESLKTYAIVAPITGTIIQRHANTGEVTQDQILFSIADFATLWAELRVYPAQQSAVAAGQTARILVNGKAISGQIAHIIPHLDKPYQLARLQFDNSALGLSPGLLVEGQIVISEFTAELAVERSAIQSMDGQRGVFVTHNDEYEFVPLQLGRGDDHYIEVVEGLSREQRYVSKNSYLIKADIEKSEAEHQH